MNSLPALARHFQSHQPDRSVQNIKSVVEALSIHNAVSKTLVTMMNKKDIDENDLPIVVIAY